MIQTDNTNALWMQWKQSNQQQDYDALYNDLHPIVEMQVNKFRADPVDDAVVRASAIRRITEAINTYKPDRGASVRTHVFNTLRRVQRDIGDMRSFARIPESRRLKINSFKSVKEELTDYLMREPTTDELADHLSWPRAEVSRIEKELRGEISEAKNPVLSTFGIDRPGARATEALDYVYPELNPQEKLVFEHTYGYGGKQVLKTNSDIARRVGVSEATVRNIKKKIGNKVTPFLGLNE